MYHVYKFATIKNLTLGDKFAECLRDTRRIDKGVITPQNPQYTVIGMWNETRRDEFDNEIDGAFVVVTDSIDEEHGFWISNEDLIYRHMCATERTTVDQLERGDVFYTLDDGQKHLMIDSYLKDEDDVEGVYITAKYLEFNKIWEEWYNKDIYAYRVINEQS